MAVSIPMHHKGTLLTVGNRLVPIDFTDLVALYTFGEGSGATLYDRSGNGNNGTIDGAVWQWDSVRKKHFLSFDGTDDSVDIGDPDALEPTDTITVAFWFKSTTAADDAYSAVRHDGHINPLQLTSGDVGRAVHFIGGTFYTAKFTWSDWNDGNWHFYVARYDSGVGMEVYIDDMTTTVATNTTTGTLDTTTNPWCLGAAIGRSAEYWDGSLDIVFIFNKALSEDERVRLKNKTAP